MAKRRVLIMGAAGRDFHNFNTVFRDDPDNSVYKGYDVRTGAEKYAGITKNLKARLLAHTNKYTIDPIANGLTRGQARAIEEVLIRNNMKRGLFYNNIIHSISNKHAYYVEVTDWAQSWIALKGL